MNFKTKINNTYSNTKNKSKLNDKLSNNERLNERGLTDMNLMKSTDLYNHQKSVQTLLMDRNDFFNQDSRLEDEQRDNYKKLPNQNRMFGEITGDELDDSNNFEKGMPIRGQFTMKKPVYDSNSHLDFNLYEKKADNKSVSYFDPSTNADFTDIKVSMNKVSNQIKPVGVCSNGIEKIGWSLYNILLGIINKSNFILNNIGLYTIFSSIYIGSSETTELELKNYFGYPKKDIVFKGMGEILYELDKLEKMINFKNIILVGNDVPINIKYADLVRDYTHIIRVDIDKPDNEAKRINKLIEKIMGAELRKPIISDNLVNLQLMFMNLAIIHPVWLIAPNNVINDVFQGKILDRQTKYMYFVSKTFKYFEDKSIKLLEMECAGNYSVGFILGKNSNLPDLDNDKIKFYISGAKPTVIDEVKIPMFKQDFKMRYTNLLKETDFVAPFVKMTVPEFIPESGVLHDVVQNISIIIDDITVNKTVNNKDYQTSRNFICNNPFIYYIRMTDLDCIIVIGTYI